MDLYNAPVFLVKIFFQIKKNLLRKQNNSAHPDEVAKQRVERYLDR